MILDANVVIALLDDQDVHHEPAVDLAVEAVDEPLLVHEVTLAVALVVPARLGLAEEAWSLLAEMGVRTARTPEGFHLYLAAVRAGVALKMPDCIVLASAERLGQPLATFDERLAVAARSRGLSVRGLPPIGRP